MLIGFCTDAATAAGAPADAEILREIGCARVFGPDASRFVTAEVIDYLRPGDVLVIADIARLAGSIEELVTIVERLHHTNVAIHAVRNEIVPGTAIGDSFGQACAVLAKFCRATAPAESIRKPRNGRRGRPSALSPEDQAHAERLLMRENVLEVARLLRVSPATIYRYFPRGRFNASRRTGGREKHSSPPSRAEK